MGLKGAKKNQGYIMKTNLLPIYELRLILLKEANPKYFDTYRFQMLRTSLAAQDYVLSGHYYEYDKAKMGLNFKKLPEYTKVHKKYNIPYDPNLFVLPQGSVNPGLVMDLSWSLQQDIVKGITDHKGNILDANKLPLSEVMQVYHNSSISGCPMDVLTQKTPEQLRNLLSVVQQKTR